MADFEMVEFERAVDQAAAPKHALLGNGFSRALRNDVFSYKALFTQADFNALSCRVRAAFDALESTDFEVVMRSLRSAATLIDLYDASLGGLADVMRNDADGLRELLATTIARNHPEGPFEVTETQFESCRSFVARFQDVYTLNYDLLLYWALMHEDGSRFEISCDDGFREPEEPGCDYVTWEVENTRRQNIFYLHGALHIFDGGSVIKKFAWSRSGQRLLDQIRSALQDNLFPLIVAEGTCDQKLERINHSNYLSRAYRSFASIRGSLLVFGHSMGPSDEHILRLVENGSVSELFVGLHGDPAGEHNQKIITRSLAMVNNRDHRGRRRSHLSVKFFDSGQAHVWG